MHTILISLTTRSGPAECQPDLDLNCVTLSDGILERIFQNN